MPAAKKSSGSRKSPARAKTSSSRSTSSSSKKSKSGSSSKSGSASKSSKSASSKKAGTSRTSKSATSSAKKATSGGARSKSPSAKSTVRKSTGRESVSKTRSSSKGLIASAVEAVAGIFAGKDTAIDLLKKDHRKVDALFARVRKNEDGNNAPTFKTIKQELQVHTHIEEKIFYPHLLEKGDKELKKIVREGLEEHTQVKTLLEEMTELRGDDPEFKAKLTVLMENVEHHVEEEEGEMFDMVEDQIDEETLRRLGSLMEGEKAKVMKAGGPPLQRGRASAAGRR